MDIKMPCADTGVEKCILLRWLVDLGDRIAPGDDIAVLKVPGGQEYDLKVYEHGCVDRLLISAGKTVSVGTVIANLTPDKYKGHTHPQISKVERYMSEPVVKTGLQKNGN